ncbi:hypothetical protein ACQPXH_20335 [Nocardia sp. CA-135953]|uniref:hypothetical protein n=1 Tax=Nocardia sp. CA-135953 TaxID=3239978 RepID=UPI003D98F210
MTSELISLPTPLLRESTTHRLRPRFEGSNICTWIGFKHVNYLVEEAVLAHFRHVGLPARTLYEAHGLCVEFIDLDTRIRSAFHLDDEVSAEVSPAPHADADQLRFTVVLRRLVDGTATRAASSTVAVVLRGDERGGAPAHPGPSHLAPYQRSHLRRQLPERHPLPAIRRNSLGRGGVGGDAVLQELTGGTNSFAWRWRIPYPYCHFTERLQMSGYLRQLEEVVDLFLMSRGVSIKRLLDEQNYIPVVPRSNISIIDEALMEEDLYTVFTVEEVFKRVTYTARMDCYVLREEMLVPTATGRITHGYAEIRDRTDWALVDFDDRLLTALRG